MDSLAGQVAVVTGASRGIGKAIALSLAEQGATLCIVGRHRQALDACANSAPATSRVHAFAADLAEDDAVRDLADAIGREVGQADILVHSAGAYGRGTICETSVEQLDVLYKVNVRGPYLLTHLLLPMLIARRGQIVFLNSTQGLNAAAGVSQYAATQHALKAIADGLREEVNAKGVRVLTIFPGRTATPRMETIYRVENRVYQPELLLQPKDIAAIILNALALPRTAEVTNICVRPLLKSY